MLDRLSPRALLLVALALPFAGCTNSLVDSLAVTPTSQSLTVGQTLQFTATGTTGHGSGHPSTTQDDTDSATWTSSTPAVASINSTGMATALTAGTTIITATMNGYTGTITASATLTVTASTVSSEPIVSLTITPGSQSLAQINQTADFIAIGTTASGTTVNLTNQSATVGTATIKAAVWSSSVPAVSTVVAATGVATAVGAGTTTITAIATNPDGTVVTGTATLSVTTTTTSSEPIASLAIIPSSQTLTAANQSAQYVAIGTTSSGTTVNLTSQSWTNGTITIPPASWASSIQTVATITSPGLATVAANPVNGVTVITATVQNPDKTIVTAAATLTVNILTTPEPIVSLAIVPGSQTSLATGTKANVNFIAIGTTASGATVNLTNSAYTVPGTTPAENIQPAAWTSSNPAVASFLSPTGGVATPNGAGATAVTALVTNPDGTVVTGSAVYTVSVPTVTEPYVSVAIVPASQTLTAVGQTGSFIAIGTTGTGATVDLTNAPNVKWSANSNGVVNLVSNGEFSAVANGVTAITVEVPNPGINGNPPDGTVVSATGSLTVALSTTPEPLLSMSIVPGSQTVAWTGQTAQFLAIGDFSASSATPGEQNMESVSSYTVTWYSSNPSVATICTPANASTNTVANCPSTPGLVTAMGPGTTAITAIATNNTDHSAVTASATFTVTGSTPNQITSLAIIPGAQTLTLPLVAGTAQPNPFVAIGTNGSGLQLPETTSVQWFSSNQAVATVDLTTGAVKALTQGTTTITAQYTNPSTATSPANVVTASATLTVNGIAAEPLLSIAIYPGTQTVNYPGQSSQLVATGTFSAAPVTQNLTTTTGQYKITWISSNPAVATVCTPANTSTNTPANCPSTPGLVTAVTQGTVAITAVASNPDGSVVTGVGTFTVTNGAAEQMTSLTIIPSSLALSATGQPGQFIAIGTSGTTGLQEDVTYSPQLAWVSSNTTVATICTQAGANIPALCPSTPGQASGVSTGSTNITAEYTNPAVGPTPSNVVTGSATVSVTTTPAAEPLLSINVAPAVVSVFGLEQTAQFLAFGTFSSAPTVLDVTNGFFHAGFPGPGYLPSQCTAALAAGDALAVETDVASEMPVTNLPNPQCAFTQVTWASLPEPLVFPINSAGAPGASGGLITAESSGTGEQVYAVAANPDGTLVYGTSTAGYATFNCPYAAPTYGTTTVTNANGTTTTTTDYNDILTVGTCNELTIGTGLFSTLTVFDASLVSTGLDQANWLVQAPSATSTWSNPLLAIDCGGTAQQGSAGGSVCEATYPVNTTVILNAPAEPGVNFGGWSSNCTPCTLDKTTNSCPAIVPPAPLYSATGPNSCSVVVGGTCTYISATGTYSCTQSNVSVGAIFN